MKKEFGVLGSNIANASRSGPLSSNLVEKLREDILKEVLPPGSKLTEQSISDAYEVSRTPVRESLRSLEREGLVELIPNRGAFVVGFSKDDMVDLFKLRKIYELQAVRWAIMRISESEFEVLEESFEFMEFYTRKQDTKKMRDINERFHKIIYKASHNRMLANILPTFQTYIKFSIQAQEYNTVHLDEIFFEHKQIFDAFVNEDPDAGVAAMENHIDNFMKRAIC